MKISFVSDSVLLLTCKSVKLLKERKSIDVVPCYSRVILPGDRVSIDNDDLHIELHPLPAPDMPGIIISH